MNPKMSMQFEKTIVFCTMWVNSFNLSIVEAALGAWWKIGPNLQIASAGPIRHGVIVIVNRNRLNQGSGTFLYKGAMKPTYL